MRRALILDLRNTPSGGNTDVAEPILGRFVTAARAISAASSRDPAADFPKDGYTRWVRARGPTRHAADGRAVRPLDRQHGRRHDHRPRRHEARDGGRHPHGRPVRRDRQFKLPASGIGVTFPTERLYHLDGTPREKWAPPNLIDLATATGDDPILDRALALLR